MTATPLLPEARLIVSQADDAASSGDFVQAIEGYQSALGLIFDEDPAAAGEFSSGPYTDLLAAAFAHATALVDSRAFDEGFRLLQNLKEWLTTPKQVEEAEALLTICQRFLLYTRSAFRPVDVVFWDADCDRDSVTAPLAAALESRGLIVQIGTSSSDFDDLSGVAEMTVPILSPGFIASDWPKASLNRMLKADAPDYGRVLPVWHQIERPDVLSASPLLENKLAFDLASTDMAAVADGIARIARPDLGRAVLHKATWQSLLNRTLLGDALRDPPFDLSAPSGDLPADLLDRVRLVRAALLPCFRYAMDDWVLGFSLDQEPYQAIREWEDIARTFHDLFTVARFADAAPGNRQSIANALIDDGEGTADEWLQATDDALAELAALPPEKIFMAVWSAAVPKLSGVVDFGFSPALTTLAGWLLNSPTPLVDADDQGRMEPGFDGSVPVQLAGPGLQQTYEDLGLDEDGLQQTEPRPWSKAYDVFISHASEDKEPLVRPLAELLQTHGARVWYDSFTLRAGHSLSEAIAAGIDSAEFGVVVLSPNFIRKHWPLKELQLLQSRAVQADGKLLAIWLDLSPDDAPNFAPLYGPDHFDAAAMSFMDLETEVLRRIRPELAAYLERRKRYLDAQAENGTNPAIAAAARASPRRHERLSDDLMRRVRLIHSALFSVYPMSLDLWLDGFLRDVNPEGEIAHWERMAAIHHEARLIAPTLLTAKGGLLGIFRKPREITDTEVFRLQMILAGPKADGMDQTLETFPEPVVSALCAMLASEGAIETLG